MTDKEMIAYLEDRIIQLEKRLAKYEPSEEEVNDMSIRVAIDETNYLSDTVGYNLSQTGQCTVTYSGTGEGVTLSYETLRNAINAAMRQ